MEKVYLPDGESNPGLLRDRQGSLPLDYWGLMCVVKFPRFKNQQNFAGPIRKNLPSSSNDRTIYYFGQNNAQHWLAQSAQTDVRQV